MQENASSHLAAKNIHSADMGAGGMRRAGGASRGGRFVAIQKRSSKLRSVGGKASAAMVPQVKGLAYVTDPSMQHLL